MIKVNIIDNDSIEKWRNQILQKLTMVITKYLNFYSYKQFTACRNAEINSS